MKLSTLGLVTITAVGFTLLVGAGQQVYQDVVVEHAAPNGACQLPRPLVLNDVSPGEGLYQCVGGRWRQLAWLTGPLSGTTAGDVVTYADADGTTQDSGTALASLAPLNSPLLTGVPAAPTAAYGTATTQLATTQFVQNTRPTLVDCGLGTNCAAPTYVTTPLKQVWGETQLTSGSAVVTIPVSLSTVWGQCSCEDHSSPVQGCAASVATSSTVNVQGQSNDLTSWHCWS